MQSSAIELSVRMGEMSVCAGGTLRTLLGSCIGVALHDRKQKIGGLAHIVLPDSRGSDEWPGKYADTAIPLLIERINALAAGETRLSAKIAGGANMFGTAAVGSIGDQNAAAIETILRKSRIHILSQHCGGSQGRRMSLDTSTGDVLIEVVGADSVRI